MVGVGIGMLLMICVGTGMGTVVGTTVVGGASRCPADEDVSDAYTSDLEGSAGSDVEWVRTWEGAARNVVLDGAVWLSNVEAWLAASAAAWALGSLNFHCVVNSSGG
jgi:hypothetical protein